MFSVYSEINIKNINDKIRAVLRLDLKELLIEVCKDLDESHLQQIVCDIDRITNYLNILYIYNLTPIPIVLKLKENSILHDCDEFIEINNIINILKLNKKQTYRFQVISKYLNHTSRSIINNKIYINFAGIYVLLTKLKIMVDLADFINDYNYDIDDIILAEMYLL